MARTARRSTPRLVGAAVALVLVATAVSTSAVVGTDRTRAAVGVQATFTQDVEDFRTATGATPSVVSTALDPAGSWFQLASGWAVLPWVDWLTEDPSRRLLLSVPMLVASSAGAFDDGALDGYHRQLARSIDQFGIADQVVIQLGGAPNTAGSPWSGEPSAYVRMFRRLVPLYRGVNPGYQLDWAPSLGSAAAPEPWYPGDDVVDVIGLKTFESPTGIATPLATLSATMLGGLAWHDTFARSHGKPAAVDDWGWRTPTSRLRPSQMVPELASELARWADDHAYRFVVYRGASAHPSPSPAAPTPPPPVAAAPPTATSPAPPVLPIPPTSAAGSFSVQGTRIVGPDGATFVPFGANLLGPHSWWDRPTAGLSDAAVTWGFNTIRLNVGYEGGSAVNNDLARIVAEYTAKGIVVMIEMHSFGNGSYPDDGALSTLSDWWVKTANQFKGNPYVWFNLMNEPGAEGPVSPRWLTVNDALVRAVRDTGSRNLIVLDGAAWGQDAFTWDAGSIPTGNSAILSYGPQLAAAYPDLLFSFHIYDQWVQSEAKLVDFIGRVHAAGLPLVVGELGDAGWVNGPKDFTAAFDACIRVCMPSGVGVLAWHGQGTGEGEGFRLTLDGPIDRINSPVNPTNLTRAGRAIWDLGHAA